MKGNEVVACPEDMNGRRCGNDGFEFDGSLRLCVYDDVGSKEVNKGFDFNRPSPRCVLIHRVAVLIGILAHPRHDVMEGCFGIIVQHHLGIGLEILHDLRTELTRGVWNKRGKGIKKTTHVEVGGCSMDVNCFKYSQEFF